MLKQLHHALSRVWTCPALRCHQQSRDGSHS
jgi:hypothetical protein